MQDLGRSLPPRLMHACTGSTSSARHRPRSIGRAPGDFQARAPARQPASRQQRPRKRDGETVQCPFKPVRRPWKLGEPRAHRGAPMGARGGTIMAICGINTAEGARHPSRIGSWLERGPTESFLRGAMYRYCTNLLRSSLLGAEEGLRLSWMFYHGRSIMCVPYPSRDYGGR